MVVMKATNNNLIERAKKIVTESSGCDPETAVKILEETDYNSKTAIVMILAGVTKEEAEARLENHRGFIRECIR